MIEVIVPNWNGIEVLPACLESLSRQTVRSFHVTVVDNGSSDGSVTFVKDSFPEVGVIALPRNHGFSRAVNEGIRKTQADLIALLNNDAEADSRWLEALTQAAGIYTSADFFASKILQYHDPRRIESAGDVLKADGCGVNRGRGEEDTGQYDREEEVFSASAAAALYRRSLFEKIGLFDEKFFAYFEDIDIGYRAQRSGSSCMFVPRAVVYHRGKYSRPGDRGWHLKQCFVNSTICQIKNLPLRYGIRNWSPIVGSHLRSVKGLFNEGNLKVVVESEKELLVRIPRALYQRVLLSRMAKKHVDRLSLFLPTRED